MQDVFIGQGFGVGEQPEMVLTSSTCECVDELSMKDRLDLVKHMADRWRPLSKEVNALYVGKADHYHKNRHL